MATTLASMTVENLTPLVLHGMRMARAPTPAFNLDDHYMLAGAILAATQSVPQENATAVEVGSFAGHTAIFAAAILQRLDVQAKTLVHAVEASSSFGIVGNLRRSDLRDRITLHNKLSYQMAPWRTPLRLFFEDSRHTYQVTKESFDVFETSLQAGGVVVMHDVVCCRHEYPGLDRFLRERILQHVGVTYRELAIPGPAAWEALEPAIAGEFKSLLNASLDARPNFKKNARLRQGMPPLPCKQICTQSGKRTLGNGYVWSLCRNIRVFQRI